MIGVPKGDRKKDSVSLISYAAMAKTPFTQETYQEGGLRDKLMSEHVLRRGVMREPENLFETMSRVLLSGTE